jgi:hypothetical protein
MQVPIRCLESDDAAFLAIVKELVEGLVVSMEPRSVYVMRVDNWFGPRWLGFAGKICQGLLGTGRNITDDAISIPPFVPARIVSERCFVRAADEYVESSEGSLHRHQVSAENVNRRLVKRAGDGLFVWCSAASAENERASLMVVVTKGTEQDAWYAGFVKRADGWSYGHLSGVGRDQLARIRALASGAALSVAPAPSS